MFYYKSGNSYLATKNALSSKDKLEGRWEEIDKEEYDSHAKSNYNGLARR